MFYSDSSKNSFAYWFIVWLYMNNENPGISSDNSWPLKGVFLWYIDGLVFIITIFPSAYFFLCVSFTYLLWCFQINIYQVSKNTSVTYNWELFKDSHIQILAQLGKYKTWLEDVITSICFLFIRSHFPVSVKSKKVMQNLVKMYQFSVVNQQLLNLMCNRFTPFLFLFYFSVFIIPFIF